MMKKTLIILLISFIFINCSNVVQERSVGFVFDQENILNPDQELNLNRIFSLHEEKTSNEIAVLTTDNFGEDNDILTFSVDYANQIGIGKKRLNNGVLIVFSKEKRQTRIAVGYGLEDVLKDEIVQSYIDSLMVPEFKSGNYYQGILKGSEAIVEFLERPENKVINSEYILK